MTILQGPAVTLLQKFVLKFHWREWMTFTTEFRHFLENNRNKGKETPHFYQGKMYFLYQDVAFSTEHRFFRFYLICWKDRSKGIKSNSLTKVKYSFCMKMFKLFCELKQVIEITKTRAEKHNTFIKVKYTFCLKVLFSVVNFFKNQKSFLP